MRDQLEEIRDEMFGVKVGLFSAHNTRGDVDLRKSDSKLP